MDINANAAAAIYQNLRKDFQKGITEAKTLADPLYEVVPSTSNQNVYGWLNHVPNLREWYKTQSRVLRNVESVDFTVTNRKFEATLSIDVDSVSDNQLGQYTGLARALGDQGKRLYDQIVFELLNNGFTTSLLYDGLSWFNTGHTVGLSTVNNRTTAVLSEANLKTAITTMSGWTVKPDKLSTARPLTPALDLVLLVPPALRFTAESIINREKINNGEDNILYHACKVMVSSYLTSTTAWYLLNLGGPIKPIFVQNREGLELKNLNPGNSDECFMSDLLIYGVKSRCAALPTLPWSAFGSTGA
jgi:phage major head subunit gpT-like protein